MSGCWSDPCRFDPYLLYNRDWGTATEMYNSADLPPVEQVIYVGFCFVSNFAVDRGLADFADLTTANPHGPLGSLAEHG